MNSNEVVQYINISLLHCVQTGSGAQTASCPRGARGSFRWE